MDECVRRGPLIILRHDICSTHSNALSSHFVFNRAQQNGQTDCPTHYYRTLIYARQYLIPLSRHISHRLLHLHPFISLSVVTVSCTHYLFTSSIIALTRACLFTLCILSLIHSLTLSFSPLIEYTSILLVISPALLQLSSSSIFIHVSLVSHSLSYALISVMF